jgi:hypothetical protein
VGSQNQGRIVKIDTQGQVSINDLRDVDIFAGFTDDELEQVAKLSIQGMISDELKILIDGKVDIEMRVEVPPSAQTLRIATLTRGILDFSAFLEPHTPTTSAICIENAETICIKVKYLDAIFQERPSIEHKMMKNLVKIMGFRYRASRTQLARLVAEMVKLGEK